VRRAAEAVRAFWHLQATGHRKSVRTRSAGVAESCSAIKIVTEARPSMSAMPSQAAQERTSSDVSNVPIPDMSRCSKIRHVKCLLGVSTG